MRLTTLPLLTAASLLAGLTGLSACPDDSASNPDSTDTGDTRDSTDTPDTPDIPPNEVIDDGTLDGTRLAGVTVAWPAPIELCTAWREGSPLTDELAYKVRITLPVNARPGLTRAALDAAALDAPVVMRSPYLDDSHRPTATSTVSRWEVQRFDTYDTLLAAVDHTLPDLGTLSEQYQVSRLDTPSPVTITATPGDVSFWWTPTGKDTAHHLIPCDAPDTYELAVEALVAEHDGVHATALRFYRTLYTETSGGSYAVHLEATQLYISNRPWLIDQARGFWAHTYVAQHHNWNDDTLVDFSRDLSGWQLAFKPLAKGNPIQAGTISKIEYLDTHSDSLGDLRVTRLATDGTPSATNFEALARPRRVDANYLARAYDHLCPTPTVGVAGWSDSRAQLVFCPSTSHPSGMTLVAVVPVMWRLDPKQAGLPADGAKITALSGRPGWSAAVGTSRVVVEPKPDNVFLVDFIDAQGEVDTGLWGELAPLTPEAGYDDPVHAASDDDAIEVRVDRVWVAQGVGHSAIFAPASFELRWGDRVDRVVAWDAIDYTNTHHNWYDSLVATTHDGLQLHWKVNFDLFGDTGLTHFVWVTDDDGTTLLPETTVHPITPEN
jgi:hypothetical protein